MKNSIEKYRVESNKTYKEISDYLSVSPQLIACWEIGIDTPNLSQSLALRDLFNVTLDELFLVNFETINFSDIDKRFKASVYDIYNNFTNLNLNFIDKNFNDSTISIKIRFQRKRHAMSQEQLAYELGVSKSLVKNWELNIGYPTLSNVILMSQYFNVSLEYFVNSKIGLDEIGLSVLEEKQKNVIINLINCYRDANCIY